MEDNIKTDLREIGCENVDRGGLVCVWDHWRAVVNTMVTFAVNACTTVIIINYSYTGNTLQSGTTCPAFSWKDYDNQQIFSQFS